MKLNNTPAVGTVRASDFSPLVIGKGGETQDDGVRMEPPAYFSPLVIGKGGETDCERRLEALIILVFSNIK